MKDVIISSINDLLAYCVNLDQYERDIAKRELEKLLVDINIRKK